MSSLQDLSMKDLLDRANNQDEYSVLFFHRNPKEYLRNKKNHRFIRMNAKVSETDQEIHNRLQSGAFDYTVNIESKPEDIADEASTSRKKRQKHDAFDHPRKITAFMTDVGCATDGPLKRMQADVANMKWTKQFGYYYHGYLLIIVDVYTRRTYLIAMKESGAKETAQAFNSFFERETERDYKFKDIMQIQTDKGGEFHNPVVKNLFSTKKANLYSTQANEGKAFIAEQKIREIKRLVRNFYERGLVKKGEK